MWVCDHCGMKYGRGREPGQLSTWHTGKCGMCGDEEVYVTEDRDYGYIDLHHIRQTARK